MMRMRKILVPVDFSEESRRALGWAVKFARKEKGGRIFLLHVLAPLVVIEGAMEVVKLAEAERKEAEKRIEEWRRKIPRSIKSTAVVVEGEASRETARLCETKDIDLVVMVTHGRHGMARLVHPSVCERVVRDAPCPVLVFHRDEKMKAIAV